MARDSTYGKRMVDWERKNDERDWKNAFRNALAVRNYERIEELVKEGIAEGYYFSYVNDPRVLELIQKYSKTNSHTS